MTALATGVLAGLEPLVAELRRRSFTVYAPVLDHGRLVIRPIAAAAELPRGVVDEQSPGTHRLAHVGDRFFDYTVPADSWKRLFFPPRLRLWSAIAGTIESEPDPVSPVALLGVRGCDLAAIEVQDRVFMHGEHPDPHYRSRREGSFIVAVNCARAAPTCFCPSMGTGPRAAGRYDLALTELDGGRFHVEAGSDRGADVLATLELPEPSAADSAQAEDLVAATAASITRTMAAAGIAPVLRNALDSPRWQSIAERCLACGNCTLVCPTCFCTAVEDTTALDGTAHHERRWDTCFSAGHSFIHGGSVRAGTPSRYRQWLTHKLSTWHEQFGTSGCTGCGRCITWCPVAIDITAEANAFVAESVGGGR